MKTTSIGFLSGLVCLLTCAFALTSCATVSAPAQGASLPTVAPPCALALAASAGNSALDKEIAHWQDKSRSARREVSNLSLEQLGWKYIEKARTNYDPGAYKLAEACAICLQSNNSQTLPESMLLQGHALHQMHKFKEAEPIARALVKARGLSFDYGLLGDVLMEQGKLPEAITAYQEMMNQKPNLQAYSRAAHIRWLTGDLKGAGEIARKAAQAGSPQDPISTAWAYTRLALYEWQLGHTGQAEQAISIALSIQPAYAPALLIRGRMFLVEKKNNEAIATLKQAAQANPLPEYQWALAEAFRLAGNTDEATVIETEMMAKGGQSDPRTLAVFMATKPGHAERALQLARQELEARKDVFTYDALAWALQAAGKTAEAYVAIKQALATGTKDARLDFHAGVITAGIGNRSEAHRYYRRAYSNRQMLLPSEREGLARQMPAT